MLFTRTNRHYLPLAIGLLVQYLTLARYSLKVYIGIPTTASHLLPSSFLTKDFMHCFLCHAATNPLITPYAFAEGRSDAVTGVSSCAGYHLVQNVLFTSLIAENINIKIQRTINLLISCGCKTWSLIFRGINMS